MCVNFDGQQYIRLLEKEKLFYDNNENNLSFYHENPKEFAELSLYETLLRDQIQYNNRDAYRQLILDYLVGKLDIDTFVGVFFELCREDEEKVDRLRKQKQTLISFGVNPCSNGFSDLLTRIYEYCDRVAIDWEPQDNYEISENEFKETLKLFYLKMEKYCAK